MDSYVLLVFHNHEIYFIARLVIYLQQTRCVQALTRYLGLVHATVSIIGAAIPIYNARRKRAEPLCLRFASSSRRYQLDTEYAFPQQVW